MVHSSYLSTAVLLVVFEAGLLSQTKDGDPQGHQEGCWQQGLQAACYSCLVTLAVVD